MGCLKKECAVTYMQECIENTPSLKQGRIIGMGGCLDLDTPKVMGVDPSYNIAHPKIVEMKDKFKKFGLSTMVRGNFLIHCCPPLVAEKEDLEFGFEAMSKALNETFKN